MKVSKGVIIKHIILIISITILLVLFIVYPFLPGEYDRFAMPLSIMAQVFGVVGLPLVVIGLMWLIMANRRLAFAIASIIVISIIALILALFATLSIGKSFGTLTVLAGVYVIVRLVRKMRHLKSTDVDQFNAATLYLIAPPVLAFIFPLVLATPLTQWSQNRTILNANQFIAEIEEYKLQYGHYPLSLQAQHKDYNTGVIGVEKYLYEPHGKGYNLFFEQPRFVMDRFGTRELIVYNPLDEQRMYSHTAWLLLDPRNVGSAQGWYASGSAGHLHWKYFWFD